MALGLKVYLSVVLLMEIGFFLNYILAAGNLRLRRARNRFGFLWNSSLGLAL